MPSDLPSEQQMLLHSLELLQQINNAMLPAYIARSAGAADALEKQAALCRAVRTMIAA